MTPMNWDDYRFFLAVARHGRLSAAGKQLGVDHATVGRRVKALETSLKTNLFDRSPQGYRLTDSGHKLVEIAEAMESGAIEAITQIGGKSEELAGAVRIGAPEGVASYLLADWAADICRQHPQLELQIVAMHRSFSLSKREADIAIGVSAPTSGRLKFRKIADHTLHLYGTEAYLERQPEINEISDLKKIRGIGFIPDLIYDKEIDYIPLLGNDIKPHLTSTSLHFQLEAVLKDAGVFIIHDFIAEKYPQLKRVLPDQISFTRAYWYIVHEDYARLKRIRMVSDSLIEHMRKRIIQAS